MTDDPVIPRKLTNRQKVFIEEYLTCFNASLAARKAGYNGASDVVGPRLLGNVGIQEVISERMKEKAMKPDEVLHRLGQQGRSSIAIFFDFKTDEDGVTTANLNWDMVREHGHLIKKIELTKDGWRLELHDGQKALELIGKNLQLFTDSLNVNMTNSIKGYLAVSPDDWDKPET
jgi:phage terminase small subunit